MEIITYKAFSFFWCPALYGTESVISFTLYAKRTMPDSQRYLGELCLIKSELNIHVNDFARKTKKEKFLL